MGTCSYVWWVITTINHSDNYHQPKDSRKICYIFQLGYRLGGPPCVVRWFVHPEKLTKTLNSGMNVLFTHLIPKGLQPTGFESWAMGDANSLSSTNIRIITHRIHVWYIIYANIGGILMVNVTIYSIYTWILWVTLTNWSGLPA